MGFGSFELICERANIPLCPLVGPYEGSSAFGQGLLSRCYARSIFLANTMIFNVGTVFIHFGILLMACFAIYTVYGKYTAVGRREMLDLFYLFFVLEVWSLVVDAGVSPATSQSYPWFVAIQAGLSSGFCCLLMLTSLLGYQLWEDGSFKSVWSLRISSLLWGVTVFLIAIFTFNGGKPSWPTLLNPRETTALMVVLYVVNAVFMLFYACASLYLTGALLRNWWAFGAQLLALFCLIAGQLLMYAFGYLICNSVRHYIDGIFFGTVCNWFAFLMIYKAYDSITAEDLEFTVSLQDHSWDEKSTSDGDGAASEYALSNYNLQTPY